MDIVGNGSRMGNMPLLGSTAKRQTNIVETSYQNVNATFSLYVKASNKSNAHASSRYTLEIIKHQPYINIKLHRISRTNFTLILI